MNFLTYATFVLFLGFAVSSCSGDDGADGVDGATGSIGTSGTNGTDGNANVTTISLPYEDITWTTGLFLGRTSNVFTLSESAVTQDIIDHGTVLGYAKLYDLWYPLPFTWENSAGSERQHITHTYSLNNITLYAYKTSGVLNPSVVSEFRFMLITDNTVTGRSSSIENIINELAVANVDVNDYYAVCAYYGINPE